MELLDRKGELLMVCSQESGRVLKSKEEEEGGIGRVRGTGS